jgi:SnoaL-like domain
MDIDTLSAHIEIRQALVQYCRGVDRGDPDLIRAAFHPDAIDEHGDFTGLGWELADRLADSSADPETSGTHLLLNVYVEFDGPDDARVESYVLAHHPLRDDQGQEYMLVFAGRYLDHFQSRGGAWKIAARQVISDWYRREELGGAMPGFPAGRKGVGRDPSYRLFPSLQEAPSVTRGPGS